MKQGPESPLPPPRLLDQLRERIRYCHYSLQTEKTYVYWVRSFIRFHRYRHPREMAAPEVEAFLSHLANELQLSAWTHPDGFSLHAGVSAGADERKKVERLCRYLARPAIATGRLSLTSQGQVRYTLKTPYQRRHHPRGLRAAGLRRAAGGAGAEAAGAPDPVPRGVRAAQPVAGGGHAGRAGDTHHV